LLPAGGDLADHPCAGAACGEKTPAGGVWGIAGRRVTTQHKGPRMTRLNRRSAIKLAGGVAAASVLGGRARAAEDKMVKIAISLPFTGSEAEALRW
jgi:hypothetical protein